MKNIFILFFSIVGITFAQAPIFKPQPNEATYSVSEIYIFKNYTRTSFEAEFGVQAPPFDAKKPVKTWFDLTVKTPTITYSTLNLNTLQFINLTLTKEEAASLNLPGEYRYEKYVVEPSDCLVSFPGFPIPPAPINPTFLTTRVVAEELAKEMGGTVADAFSVGGTFSGRQLVCQTDKRNVWEIVLGQKRVVAGILYEQKNRNGIGYPGTWDLTGEEPNWKPAQVITTSTNVMRTPVRQLYPGETFSRTPFGVYLNRSDVPVPGSGSFTEADRKMLEEILKLVRELSKM
jgi:hypothetical protein